MIKRLPRPVQSEETIFRNQYYGWLNDSHYWIETEKVVQCKWCGKIQPMDSSQASLCRENPEIIKIKEEMRKNNGETF